MAEWISPTGYVDPDNAWYNEFQAYDDNTGSRARTYNRDLVEGQWNIEFLELTHAPLPCSKIRIWVGNTDFDLIDVDVYYEGAWHDAYEGVYTANDWSEIELSVGTQTITKARFRMRSAITAAARYATIYEFDFWETYEVTYYFNARGDVVWANPDNIVDNNLETFGYTAVNGSAQLLTGNTCPGDDLGTITKVELRLFGKGDGDDKIVITPVFAAGDGDPHDTVPVVSPGDWTPYVDITDDPNHPNWSLWSHIQTLDCKIAFEGVGKKNTVHCAKVEIRVTYEPVAPPPEYIPRHSGTVGVLMI